MRGKSLAALLVVGSLMMIPSSPVSAMDAREWELEIGRICGGYMNTAAIYVTRVRTTLTQQEAEQNCLANEYQDPSPASKVALISVIDSVYKHIRLSESAQKRCVEAVLKSDPNGAKEEAYEKSAELAAHEQRQKEDKMRREEAAEKSAQRKPLGEDIARYQAEDKANGQTHEAEKVGAKATIEKDKARMASL